MHHDDATHTTGLINSLINSDIKSLLRDESWSEEMGLLGLDLKGYIFVPVSPFYASWLPWVEQLHSLTSFTILSLLWS